MAAGGVRQKVTTGGGLAVKADVFPRGPWRRTPTWICRRRGRRRPGRGRCSSGSRSGCRRGRRRCVPGSSWAAGGTAGATWTDSVRRWAAASPWRTSGWGWRLSWSGQGTFWRTQAEGFEEWGASLALRAGPGVTRRGAWVSIEPEWGAAASRMHAMWGAAAGSGTPPRRGRLASPARSRGGLRLAAGYALPEAGADLRLEGTRETYGPRAEPNLRVGLSAILHW